MGSTDTIRSLLSEDASGASSSDDESRDWDCGHYEITDELRDDLEDLFSLVRHVGHYNSDAFEARYQHLRTRYPGLDPAALGIR